MLMHSFEDFNEDLRHLGPARLGRQVRDQLVGVLP